MYRWLLSRLIINRFWQSWETKSLNYVRKLLRITAIVLLIIVFLIVVYKQFFLKAAFIARSSVIIENRKLREISGMVLSERNPGKIWVHNDGARGIRLFLIDKSGNLKAEFKSEKRVFDWEDIALGPPNENDLCAIYAGDIGDNYQRREAVLIYRFLEPVPGDSIKEIEEFYLRYPDGSRDAEAMMVDPLSRKLYIISKREDNPGIYSYPIDDFVSGDTVILQKDGTLKLDGAGILKWITAADISRDGLQILVRTYGKVFYWKRKPEETIEQAMARKPKTLFHKGEIQGESIGFSSNGKGFYTISEGRNSSLNFNTIAD